MGTKLAQRRQQSPTNAVQDVVGFLLLDGHTKVGWNNPGLVVTQHLTSSCELWVKPAEMEGIELSYHLPSATRTALIQAQYCQTQRYYWNLHLLQDMPIPCNGLNDECCTFGIKSHSRTEEGQKFVPSLTYRFSFFVLIGIAVWT